jgi:hypothetical protein
LGGKAGNGHGRRCALTLPFDETRRGGARFRMGTEFGTPDSHIIPTMLHESSREREPSPGGV